MPIHAFNSEVESLAKEILAYSLLRLKDDPPLDGPRTAEDLFQEVGNTITAKGLGGHEALEVFTNVLAKACISTDHPRNLAFIPSAPTEYSNLFDLVVGASSLADHIAYPEAQRSHSLRATGPDAQQRPVQPRSGLDLDLLAERALPLRMRARCT